MLNSNISTCPHNMVNFGSLTAEICWRVWGTLANFNRFRVLASLLHRRRSTEVNKTLQDVFSWTGTLYIHFWGLLPPDGILPAAKFTLRPIAFSYWKRYCRALEQRPRQPNFVAWYNEWNYGTFARRGCHLYSAGRSSRWESAHILVLLHSSFRPQAAPVDRF